MDKGLLSPGYQRTGGANSFKNAKSSRNIACLIHTKYRVVISRIHLKSLAHILDKIRCLLSVLQLLVSIHTAFPRWTVFQLLFCKIPFLIAVSVVSSHLGTSQHAKRQLQMSPLLNILIRRIWLKSNISSHENAKQSHNRTFEAPKKSLVPKINKKSPFNKSTWPLAFALASLRCWFSQTSNQWCKNQSFTKYLPR